MKKSPFPTQMFALLLGFAVTSLAAKEDCPKLYPGDAFAQCVCECQNTFEQDIINCPTESCIGAAAIKRTSCISGCALKYESSGDAGSSPFPITNKEITQY